MANATNTDSATSGTSKLLSFTPTAGRLLVLALSCTGVVAGVTGGGTWAQVGTNIVGGNGQNESMWWTVATGGATTPSWTQTALEMVCCEYDVSVVSQEDFDVGSGNGTAISSGSISTAGVDIVVGMTNNTTGAVTYTGSWVVDKTVINNEQVELASIINAAPGTYAMTTSGSYSNWEAKIVGLQTGTPDPSLRTNLKRPFAVSGRPHGFRPGNAR